MHFSRVLLLIVVFSITSLSAQVNSPYSRYGLGNIFPATFGASNGMAGLSAAYFTPTNINYLNPASYSEIGFAIFDVGAAGNVVRLETATEKFTSGDGNLSYMAFGFPVLKKLRYHKFGLSFGLIPYSGIQYNIIEQVPTEDPLLGTIEYNYVGDGTLYQFYGGLGYKYQTEIDSTKKKLKGDSAWVYHTNLFSIGANAANLFGELSNITYASFPDQINSQTTKLTRTSRINGGIFNYGLGYQKQFIRKNDTDRDYLIWRAGASYSPELNVNGKQSVVWTNIEKNGNYEFITDTLYAEPDTSGNINLPASYQGGISFSFQTTDNEDKNQFTLGAQYSKTMWSNYSGFQDAGTLADSWRVSISAEFIPKRPDKSNAKNASSQKSLYALRLGGYSGKSNLVVNGIQLNDAGITMGASIPLGNAKSVSRAFVNSRLNLYLNAGQRGTTDIIKESYYNFGIGFTLVDSGWFRKYKLN
ncbi:MAG: hypothetical protein ACHQFW_04310 [Chitinophagales bacterium]